MRLTCPNCDAQYEVGDDAVPPPGRDVQCSNCGHAWFQSPAGSESVLAVEAMPADAAPPAAGPRLGTEVDGAAAPDPDDDEREASDRDAAPAFDQPPPLKPREIDESVFAVLREEAERETAARRRDAEAAVAAGAARADLTAPGPSDGPLAGQAIVVPVAAAAVPGPGIVDNGGAATPAATAWPDGGADERFADPAIAGSRPSKGRELLPDIDAIKSTLQAGSGHPDKDTDLSAEGYEPPRRSVGFRAGFLLTVATGILLAIVYVTAPGIAARFPATGPMLGSYVDGIDDARLWLDGLARRAGDSLTAQGSGQGSVVPAAD